MRLAGIEPTTLGFGGQYAHLWEAALLLQLLDSTEYSNRQQKATMSMNRKKLPQFSPQISPQELRLFTGAGRGT